MTQIAPLSKIAYTLILGVLLSVWSPVLVKRATLQQSLPERIKGVETTVGSMEQRLDKLEIKETLQDEQLATLRAEAASVRATQSGVISVVIPIFLFMCTASWQEWQRIRGKGKTRSTDARTP